MHDCIHGDKREVGYRQYRGGTGFSYVLFCPFTEINVRKGKDYKSFKTLTTYFHPPPNAW